jgi:hypothetical protein
METPGQAPPLRIPDLSLQEPTPPVLDTQRGPQAEVLSPKPMAAGIIDSARLHARRRPSKPAIHAV